MSTQDDIDRRTIEELKQQTMVLQLRRALRPKGTKCVVQMQMKPATFFSEAFIQQGIDEMERKARMVAVGLEEFSVLETLAIHLLNDSAEF